MNVIRTIRIHTQVGQAVLLMLAQIRSFSKFVCSQAQHTAGEFDVPHGLNERWVMGSANPLFLTGASTQLNGAPIAQSDYFATPPKSLKRIRLKMNNLNTTFLVICILLLKTAALHAVMEVLLLYPHRKHILWIQFWYKC